MDRWFLRFFLFLGYVCNSIRGKEMSFEVLRFRSRELGLEGENVLFIWYFLFFTGWFFVVVWF